MHFRQMIKDGYKKEKEKATLYTYIYILSYTNNKMNIVIKLVYLQIKHPQSIYPRFFILVLNLKTELLDLTLAVRLFHIRDPLK